MMQEEFKKKMAFNKAPLHKPLAQEQLKFKVASKRDKPPKVGKGVIKLSNLSTHSREVIEYLKKQEQGKFHLKGHFYRNMAKD